MLSRGLSVAILGRTLSSHRNRPLQSTPSTALGALVGVLTALLVGAAAPLAQVDDPPEGLMAPVPSSTGVTQISIEGQLDVGTQSLVRRAIDHAEENDNRLVVVLNTPGGQVELMWKIARALGDASDRGVFTVVWVNDHAVSAGALVALACERIYMRNASQIGSATPVMATPGGITGLGDDPEVREKMYSSLRSDF